MRKNVLIVIWVSVISTSLFFVWLQRPSLEILKSWRQPESINYNSFDPYFLNVVKDNLDLGHLPFSLPQNYFIYVGNESAEVSYGHVKNYSFEYNQNIIEYLNLCTVEWGIEGVTFEEPNGHTLFIPKESFTGGR